MSSGYLGAIFAALEANAARVAKPIPVDVPNVGKIYVRPRLVSEFEEAEEAVLEGDYNNLCRNVAKLVCNEDGTRISDDERATLAALFVNQPQMLVIEIGQAADGSKDNPEGN